MVTKHIEEHLIVFSDVPAGLTNIYTSLQQADSCPRRDIRPVMA